MGVMECYRKNCEQIMCGTYIDSVGYICYECKAEFEEYLNEKGIEELPEGKMIRELKRFMETTKDEYRQSEPMNVSEFFKQYE